MKRRYLNADKTEAHTTPGLADLYPYVYEAPDEYDAVHGYDEYACDYCEQERKGAIWICALGTAMCPACMTARTTA